MSKTGSWVKADTTDPQNQDIEIIEKPRPGYTDQARGQNVQGQITLLVLFSFDGQITEISVLQSLGGGLTVKALSTARKVKFSPKIRNGKPVSQLKIIQYNFTIY